MLIKVALISNLFVSLELHCQLCFQKCKDIKPKKKIDLSDEAPVDLSLALSASCVSQNQSSMDYANERLDMVNYQIKARGIKDKRVLEAMVKVPRHLFVPEPYTNNAYEDTPLPIGLDQTISQPYIVAFMTEALIA